MKDSEKNYLEFAHPSSDQELLEFYNKQSMEGDISLSLNRDPSFFSSVEVEGSKGQVVIARSDSDHRVTALGHICSKLCHINSSKQSSYVGYLSGLRIEEKLRGSFLLFKCFHYLKKVHLEAKFAPFYLTTIMEDNEKAKKILESGRAGLPTYNDFGLLRSYLLKVGSYQWFKKKEKSFFVRKAKNSDVDQVVEFLNIYGSLQRQFFPQYSQEDFLKPTRLLKCFNFEKSLYLCFDKDELIGTLGVWDQSQFRRWFVKAYSVRFKIFKPFYNIYSRLFGKPILPREGEAFHYSFLSMVCIKNDNPKIFRSLLQEIWKDYKDNKSTVLCLGLHERDPLLEVIKSHPFLEIKSRLYVVHWEDGTEDFKKLDSSKIPYLEIGSL